MSDSILAFVDDDISSFIKDSYPDGLAPSIPLQMQLIKNIADLTRSIREHNTYTTEKQRK